jgi:hypothetical protein
MLTMIAPFNECAATGYPPCADLGDYEPEFTDRLGTEYGLTRFVEEVERLDPDAIRLVVHGWASASGANRLKAGRNCDATGGGWTTYLALEVSELRARKLAELLSDTLGERGLRPSAEIETIAHGTCDQPISEATSEENQQATIELLPINGGE